MYKVSVGVVAGLLALGVGLSLFVPGTSTADEKKADKPLDRTRKQVRMLDDLYKTTIVMITERYVEDESSPPAGALAVKLFDVMKKKGWHEVRLLDATGDPITRKNSPRDDFERKAVAELKGGKSYFETVIEKDGERYLRAATPIPVVSKKCIYCHEHYADVKDGAPIGAMGYTIKIE